MCDKINLTMVLTPKYSLVEKYQFNGLLDKIVLTNCQPKFDQLKTWYIAKVQGKIAEPAIKNDADATQKLERLIDHLNRSLETTLSEVEILKKSNSLLWRYHVPTKQLLSIPGRIRHENSLILKCEKVVKQCWDDVAALDLSIRRILQSNGISAEPGDLQTAFKFDVPDMTVQLQEALQKINFIPENEERIQTETQRVFSESIKSTCQQIEDGLSEAKGMIDAHVESSCRHPNQEISNDLELGVKLLDRELDIKGGFTEQYCKVKEAPYGCTNHGHYNTFQDTFPTIVDCLARKLKSMANAMKECPDPPYPCILPKLNALNRAVRRVEFEIRQCNNRNEPVG